MSYDIIEYITFNSLKIKCLLFCYFVNIYDFSLIFLEQIFIPISKRILCITHQCESNTEAACPARRFWRLRLGGVRQGTDERHWAGRAGECAPPLIGAGALDETIARSVHHAPTLSPWTNGADPFAKYFALFGKNQHFLLSDDIKARVIIFYSRQPRQEGHDKFSGDIKS